MLYANLYLEDCIYRGDWTWMDYILFKTEEVEDYVLAAYLLEKYDASYEGKEFFVDCLLDAIIHKFERVDKYYLKELLFDLSYAEPSIKTLSFLF